MPKTSGSFRKGDGRTRKKKGDVGKVKKEARELFQQLLDHAAEIDQTYKKPKAIVLFDRVAAQDPAKALMALGSFAEFVIGKINRVEHSGKDGNEMVIKFVQGAKPNT